MLHRRSTIPALLLALPLGAALTSCGFDYPTDQVNQIAAGANEREASVDVLGARILATADGTGRLIGSLANNNDEPASLVAVSSDEGTVTTDFRPIELGPGDGVNLADKPVVHASGEFAAGEVVSLTYEFDTGEVVTLNVPVVKHCHQYADVEVPEAESSPTDEASATATDETSEAHSEESHAEEAHAEETVAEDTHGAANYICDHETPDAGEGGGGH